MNKVKDNLCFVVLNNFIVFLGSNEFINGVEHEKF